LRDLRSVVTSVLFTAAGIALIVMGAMNGRFSPVGSRYIVVVTLIGATVVLAISSAVTRRAVPDGYGKVFGTVSFMLCAGLVALAIFFGFSGIFSDGAYAVLLAVFLTLYGIAMVFAALANFVLSDTDYRVFIFELVRQAPHLYYRYRT